MISVSACQPWQPDPGSPRYTGTPFLHHVVGHDPAKGQGTFRDYDLGFVHIDIKHLPKLQTSDGERRRRHLFVAIERRSRSVHLAVRDDKREASAIAFLREAAEAFPFASPTYSPITAAALRRLSPGPAPSWAPSIATPVPVLPRPAAWSSASTAA